MKNEKLSLSRKIVSVFFLFTAAIFGFTMMSNLSDGMTDLFFSHLILFLISSTLHLFTLRKIVFLTFITIPAMAFGYWGGI